MLNVSIISAIEAVIVNITEGQREPKSGNRSILWKQQKEPPIMGEMVGHLLRANIFREIHLGDVDSKSHQGNEAVLAMEKPQLCQATVLPQMKKDQVQQGGPTG